MKTILIAHNYTENSFSAMSFHLAHHLAEEGNRVVYISHKPFFKDVKIITKDKGEIIVFSWPSERRPTSFNDFLWFAKIYFMYKPEIIIGHFVGSNIAIIVSKFLSFGRVKSYVYYHTLRNQILMDSKNSFIKNEYLFLRKKLFYEIFCDNIICPSELAKKRFSRKLSLKKGNSSVESDGRPI
jgi:hypothetical protein